LIAGLHPSLLSLKQLTTGEQMCTQKAINMNIYANCKPFQISTIKTGSVNSDAEKPCNVTLLSFV